MNTAKARYPRSPSMAANLPVKSGGVSPLRRMKQVKRDTNMAKIGGIGLVGSI